MAVVLVADDEPDVRLALVTLLEVGGHKVVEAEDGTEVLPMAREQKPDLILLDIAMPKMDGFEALRQVKAEADTRHIPVILVTAKGRPGDRTLGRELGACDYISKPWFEGEVELRSEWALQLSNRRGGEQGAQVTPGPRVVPF